MFSDHYSVLQLVALFKQHGICRVVLCPGSRNTPLIQTFSTCGEFECRSVTDERSAGFMAIGWALQCNAPVVVCVTSGSALLNLHPAVSEAFYSQIPLVVVSADRPKAWIGQMDGQTLPQSGVFGSLVRCSVSLPEGETSVDRWYINRLLNEALLEINHYVKGPVHINIPLSEPLFGFSTPALPQVRFMERWKEEDLSLYLSRKLPSYQRIMVLCGQFHEQEAMCVAPFLPCHKAACLVEHPSNMTGIGECIQGFDTLLAVVDEKEQQALLPDLVITVGGHIVSKRIKQFLRKEGVEHWHVSPDGLPVDIFMSMTVVIETHPQKFFEVWQSIDLPASEYVEKWRTLCNKVFLSLSEYSQPYAVQRVLHHLPSNSVLHLSNSSTVRLAEFSRLPEKVTVCINRGVNGIEGCLSSAVGYAFASDRLNIVMLGDLSFFYDMNALCVGSLPSSLRIVLFNNGGGGIFHSMTPSMNEGLQRFVTAEHQLKATDWATSRGFCYLSAENPQQLEQALSILMRSHSDQPFFLEVFTQKDNDAVVWKSYYESIKEKI